MKLAFYASLLLLAAQTAGAQGFQAQGDSIKSGSTPDCERVSERAKSEGVQVLILGIEGLAQFRGSDVQALYAYRMVRRAGKELRGHPVFKKSGGSLLTHGVLFKLVQKFAMKTEVLVFAQQSKASLRNSSAPSHWCAAVWMKEPGRKLIILGHSYGANAAADLAEALNGKGILVEGLFTIDGMNRGSISRPLQVRHMENFYISGESVPSADVNEHLGGQEFGHMDIPRAPIIFQATADFINSTLNSFSSDNKRRR